MRYIRQNIFKNSFRKASAYTTFHILIKNILLYEDEIWGWNEFRKYFDVANGLYIGLDRQTLYMYIMGSKKVKSAR